jgi:hypothetical protein
MKKIIRVVVVASLVAVLCGRFAFIYHQPLTLPKAGTSDQSGKWVDATIPSQRGILNNFGRSDYITIHAKEPSSPQEVPLYKGIINPGDSIDKVYGDVLSEKSGVPSEQEVPIIAESAIEQYGGLPSDAYLGFSNTSYAQERNRRTDEILERWPMNTVTVYWREPVSGIPIVGQSDKLAIVLGENGKVLKIFKIWRTLEYTGRNVSIITPHAAIEKMQSGESLYRPMTDEGISITNISLGFYERSMTEPQIYLEPVWMFGGSTPRGDEVEFYVYARQFSNFTATPAHGKAPLTVTFTDTSDASPKTWNWNFGDGTTSKEQNPAHTYTAAGAYTVTLKAANDLGSDTITKTNCVLIGKKAIVLQIGSELDNLVAAITATLPDSGLRNSLTKKAHNAKAKNEDSLKFIDQNKEEQANAMLNADVGLTTAFRNEVDAQRGKGITIADAAMLDTKVGEIQGLIKDAIATPI